VPGGEPKERWSLPFPCGERQGPPGVGLLEPWVPWGGALLELPARSEQVGAEPRAQSVREGAVPQPQSAQGELPDAERSAAGQRQELGRCSPSVLAVAAEQTEVGSGP
jgi:hypothetical protein